LSVAIVAGKRRPLAGLLVVLSAEAGATAVLGQSPSTIYRLLKERKIPGFKLDADWRFSQESLERWVKERESDSGIDQSSRPLGRR
jgi:excisionase family DNA binding protein